MFAAVLGHDLRNPLSAIMSTADLLPLVSREERVISAARRIRESSARMGRMIDQLLDVARMRSGYLALTPTSTGRCCINLA